MLAQLRARGGGFAEPGTAGSAPGAVLLPHAPPAAPLPCAGSASLSESGLGPHPLPDHPELTGAPLPLGAAAPGSVPGQARSTKHTPAGSGRLDFTAGGTRAWAQGGPIAPAPCMGAQGLSWHIWRAQHPPPTPAPSWSSLGAASMAEPFSRDEGPSAAPAELVPTMGYCKEPAESYNTCMELLTEGPDPANEEVNGAVPVFCNPCVAPAPPACAR